MKKHFRRIKLLLTVLVVIVVIAGGVCIIQDNNKDKDEHLTVFKGVETIELPKNDTSGKSLEEDEWKDVPSTFRACTNGSLHYWLYTPANPTEQMPLIVYLHGGSGKGDDLNILTSVEGFPKYLQDGELGDVRAYVVIPQCPRSNKGWEESGEEVYPLIQTVVSQYMINKDKISLTGHSMGGTGTWSLAAAYPDLFYRIAPLSGSVSNATEEAELLKNTSVWAFVGSKDEIVPPESSENVVSEMRSLGNDSTITVFDGANHFMVPSLAYLDKSIGLIEWLVG